MEGNLKIIVSKVENTTEGNDKPKLNKDGYD